MVFTSIPARFGRQCAILASAAVLCGGGAYPRDGAASVDVEAADAQLDWDAEGEEDQQAYSPITVGRALDLVGRPVDIVASTRKRQALAEAAKGGSARTTGKGALPAGMPVNAAYMTSGFGLRTHPLLGISRGHAGVDLAAPAGSPIRATQDGKVDSAGWRGGYGLAVQLNHGKGVASRYAHMSRIAVYPGQAVKRGDVIGYVGSTGLSTGPHLHYEIRINGAAVNPYASLGR